MHPVTNHLDEIFTEISKGTFLFQSVLECVVILICMICVLISKLVIGNGASVWSLTWYLFIAGLVWGMSICNAVSWIILYDSSSSPAEIKDAFRSLRFILPIFPAIQSYSYKRYRNEYTAAIYYLSHLNSPNRNRSFHTTKDFYLVMRWVSSAIAIIRFNSYFHPGPIERESYANFDIEFIESTRPIGERRSRSQIDTIENVM